MAFAQQQAQPRPDAELGAQTKSQAAPPAAAPATRGAFMQRRRAVVGTAVVQKGKRLGVMQAISVVFFVVLAFIDGYAFMDSEPECSSAPVPLRGWFLATLIMHAACAVCCLGAMHTVLSVLHAEMAAARSASREGAQDSNEAPLAAWSADFLVAVSVCHAVLSVFILLWTIIGFLSLNDADRPKLEPLCKKAGDNYFFVAVLSLIGIACCSCCTMADVHFHNGETKKGSTGEVEV